MADFKLVALLFIAVCVHVANGYVAVGRGGAISVLVANK